MMNMMNMMKQAQNIQKKLMEAQTELADMNIAGESGNGSVSVTCDGKGIFKSIKLSAEALNPENPSSVSAHTPCSQSPSPSETSVRSNLH